MKDQKKIKKINFDEVEQFEKKFARGSEL